MQRLAATLLFVFLAAGTASAQEEKPAAGLKNPLSFEVGIKTNALLDVLFEADGGGNTANPYLLAGKMGFGKAAALRAGVGGARKKSKETEQGFADSKTTLDQHLDARLGIERRFSLGKKWRGSIGADAVARWGEKKEVEDSGFDAVTVSEEENAWGGGLAVGLQFDLTQRLSLGTEGFFYYTHGKTDSGRFFKNFPEFNDQVKTTTTWGTQIGLPSALYIVFRF